MGLSGYSMNDMAPETGVGGGFFSDIGANIGMGMGISTIAPKRSSGSEYMRGSRLLRGGWNSGMARGAKYGALQSVGWMKNEGVGGMSFLGWEGERAKQVASGVEGASKFGPVGTFRTAAKGGIKSLAGTVAKGALPVGFTAFEVYQGFKEGGVWGAAKSLGKSAVMWGAQGAGEAIAASMGLGGLSSAVLPAAAIGAAAYGTYKALEYGQKKTRGLRELEFCSPIEDQFGNAATLRQRSLMAIQRGFINGRAAMGNEAMLMHTPMMR